MTPQTRTVKIGLGTRGVLFGTRGVDKDKRTIDVSFSSETPVLRIPLFGEPFLEVLDHSPGSVDMKRSAPPAKFPIRDEHHGPIIGVGRNIRLEDRQLRGEVFFSPNRDQAEVVMNDLADEVIGNGSVAYFVHEYELLKSAADGLFDTYRATRWEPVHFAFVGEPADLTVGAGRSVRSGDGESDAREVRVVIPERFNQDAGEGERETRAATAQGRHDMDPEKTEQLPVDVAAERAEAVATATKQEMTRVRAIMTIKRKLAHIPEIAAKADEFIENGRAVTEFQDFVVEKVGKREAPPTSSTPDEAPNPRVGMEDRDLSKYSILRACQSFMRNEKSFEMEIAQDAEKLMGRSPRGFAVPYEVFADPMFVRRFASPSLRTDVLTTTGGAGVKGTVLLAGSFVDLLRSRVVLAQLGMQVLDGLVGDVDIPRLDAGATTYWVGENTDITADTTTSLGTFPLVPHTVGARVPVSRRMLLQSTPGIEGIVRNDIVSNLAIAIDTAGINGSGDAPTGILQLGIGAGPSLGTDGGDPTWNMVVKLEEEVAIDNADVGRLAYLTNPKVRGKMKVTQKGSAVDRFLWDSTDKDSPLNGYPVAVSNVVPSTLVKAGSGATLSALIFGNFGDLLMGLWGVLDVMPDPYADAAKGGLVMRVFQDVDFNLRHLESMAASEEIATV